MAPPYAMGVTGRGVAPAWYGVDIMSDTQADKTATNTAVHALEERIHEMRRDFEQIFHWVRVQREGGNIKPAQMNEIMRTCHKYAMVPSVAEWREEFFGGRVPAEEELAV